MDLAPVNYDPFGSQATQPDSIDEAIQQASERYDIPPERLRAVIATESNFDPKARSSAGAEGLMQLMPATAKALGVTDPYDPDQNIDGGARYLKTLYDRYGNWDDAHAAYNAGPGRVDSGKPLPAETRDYVQKIDAQVKGGGDDSLKPVDYDPFSQGQSGDTVPVNYDPFGGTKLPPAAEALRDFGEAQAMAVGDEAAKPAQPAPQEQQPQIKDSDQVIAELAAMPFPERVARLAGGLPVGSFEAIAQMAAQVPQMAYSVAGFAKAVSEGKMSEQDFQNATASITPKWVSDLATSEAVQPETYAGALLSDLGGAAFKATGRALAAPGAGLVSATQAAVAGEGTSGARERYSQLYEQLAPVTEQLFNAGVLGKIGADEIVKAKAKFDATRNPDDPVASAAPVMAAGSVDEAIAEADKAANGTALATAPEAEGETPAEPTIGMPPNALLSEEEAVAPDVAPQATNVAETATPEVDQAIAQAQRESAPSPPAGDATAAPEPPESEGIEAPAPRAVEDMTPHEIALAARLTRSADTRGALQAELQRRIDAGEVEPQAPSPELSAMTVEELDNALRLARGADQRDAISAELLSRVPRDEPTEAPNADQGNAQPIENAAGEPPQPGAALGDRNAGNAQPPAPGAEGGSDTGNAGDHRLGADQVASEATNVAPGATPEPEDYTTPRGEVKTFSTQKLAKAYLAQNPRVPRNFAPRQVGRGEWRLSRAAPTEAQTAARQAAAERLRTLARTVQPDDDLATLLRKSGGINASELTRDGADPKSVAAALRFGAAKNTGGMSLDGAAEVMAQHGYDVYDEHGAIDATKARDLIQQVLDGERVYSPEGYEMRAAKAQARQEKGLDPNRQELAAADLTPADSTDASIVTQAAEIDEGAVERLAIQYGADDAGFLRAVKEFVDAHNQDNAPPVGGEARAETPPRGAEAAAPTAEAVDVPRALARVRAAADAIRQAKPHEVGPLTGELGDARAAAERAGASPMDIMRALEGGEPRRPIEPERLVGMLERARESKTETPAEAGVSASELPPRTLDTMSEAIALSSPNGRMSKAARARANERVREQLFGREGMKRPEAQQPTESEALLRQAKELRDAAARGLKPRAYLRKAEELERRAAELQPERPALELKGETEGEIRTREAQQAKEAETKRAQENAPGPEGFTLTGSDRPADEAEARGQKPMLRRGIAAGGMHENEVRAALKDTIQSSRVPIRVVQSVEDLRREPGLEGAPDDVKGAYHNGRIYAVADNLANPLDAERTIARHEVTHAGIDALYGGDRAREVALTKLMAKNPALRAIAAAWREQYGAEHLADSRARGLDDAAAQRALRLDSFEEAVAHFAQDGNDIKGWQQFAATVQEGLRSLGLHRLADWLEGATNAEAMRFITEARDATRARAATPEGRLAAAFDRGNLDTFEDRSSIASSYPRTLTAAFRGYQEGRVSEGHLIDTLRRELEARRERRLEARAQDRVRGYDWFRERLARAGRTGELSRDEVSLANWLLDENPHLANDLGLSIREGGPDSPNGQYNALARIVTIFSGKSNAETPVHEILHHTERMMPAEVQAGIRHEWLRQVNRAVADIKKSFEKGAPKDSAWTSEKRVLLDMFIEAARRGDDRMALALWKDGLGEKTPVGLQDVIPYKLAAASEFWAVNGARILHERATASSGSWIAKARQWLGELGEKAKSVFGLASDAPVLRGLRSITEGAGEFKSERMISNLTEANDTAREPPKFARAAAEILPERAMKAASIIKSGLSETAKQREIFRGGFRASLATLDRFTGQVDAALRESRAMVDSIPVADRWKAMHEYQEGGVGAVTDPRLRPFFSAWKANVEERTQRIQQWGEGYLKETLPNYFSQVWKDPKSALQWYQRIMAKGPLEGGKRFLKKRTYANYQEGMSWKVFRQDGSADYFATEREAKAAAKPGDTVKPPLEPISQNPVDIAQLSLQQMDKFIAMHEVRRWLDKRGWVKTWKVGDEIPEGYAKVDDPAFRSRATFPFTDKEGNAAAASIEYHYLVPELIAKDINNYLDPGLYRFGLWKSFRYAQNLLLSARLGLSAFHAGFTTVDTLVSHVDAGARYLLSGDIGKAAQMWAKALTSPISAPLEGRRLLEQFYGEQASDPNTAAVLQFLTQGGARGRMDPTDFNNSWVKLKRAWLDSDIKGTALEVVPAAIEGVMRPIMHYLVPWQKMTARVLLAKLELDRVAEQLGQKRGNYEAIVNAMGEDAMRQIAYKVVQQVDDRLGQVAYANLFWNKFAKDVAQASIQSVGWNVGTMNVIFGGMKDVARIFKPEELLAPLDKAGRVKDATLSRVTGRLSYLIALNATVGMAGASLQYLMTGQWPEELRDYFFPKTGRKNPDGTAERISLPSYVKDEFAFAKHPITTIGHKLHPAFSMVSELLHNEDFYGNQIVNPDDPWTKVAQQVAAYLGKAALPYSVQNANQNLSKGASVPMTAAPFFGITPAPADVTRSPFESYVADAYRNSYHKSLTPEEQERAQARRDALDAIRRGEEPDLTPFNARERASIYHASRTPIQESRFARLSLQQKMSAYARATDEERDRFKLRQLLERDFRAHGRNLSDDDRERVQDLLSQ